MFWMLRPCESPACDETKTSRRYFSCWLTDVLCFLFTKFPPRLFIFCLLQAVLRGFVFVPDTFYQILLFRLLKSEIWSSWSVIFCLKLSFSISCAFKSDCASASSFTARFRVKLLPYPFVLQPPGVPAAKLFLGLNFPEAAVVLFLYPPRVQQRNC